MPAGSGHGPSKEDLAILLSPKSVAVMGASSDPTKAGGKPIHYMKELGFPGSIFPVNPNRETVQGLPCFSTLSDINDEVDLCVIAVPMADVETCLHECGANHVKAAVVFASGYAETGPEGREAQVRLREIADSYGIVLAGPNCLGFINVESRVAATFTTALERNMQLEQGGVSLISQSGAVGAFLLGMAQDDQIGLSHFITAGNEASVGLIDYGTYLLDDDKTSVLALYMEGVDGKEFMKFADAALTRDKPITAIKVGTSKRGAEASLTHTGKIAGSDDVYAAVFEHFGVSRAESVEQLLDFSIALGQSRRTKGNGVGVVSLSGGVAILLADWCEKLGLDLVEFSPDTESAVKSALPWFGGGKNPVDTTGRPIWEPDIMLNVLKAVIADPGVDIVLCHIGLNPGTTRQLSDAIQSAAAGSEKPVFICWLPEQDAEALSLLRAQGIPIFRDPVRMAKAAQMLVTYCARRNALVGRQGVSSKAHPEVSFASLPLEPIVTEYEAKRWLATQGIGVPAGGLAHTVEEAVSIADSVGYPVCLKVISTQLLHRSDVGAVRLGNAEPSDVQRNFDDLFKLIASTDDEVSSGVLVESQEPSGVELILSGFRDPDFGTFVLCGVGGVFVEVLSSRVVGLAPVDRDEAHRMLEKLEILPMLEGARGTSKRDVNAAVEAIVCMSQLIAEAPSDVQMIEINPLLVGVEGGGAVALDALVIRTISEQ